jgi:hypothetical protein
MMKAILNTHTEHLSKDFRKKRKQGIYVEGNNGNINCSQGSPHIRLMRKRPKLTTIVQSRGNYVKRIRGECDNYVLPNRDC